jgi:diacylglycerol kinase
VALRGDRSFQVHGAFTAGVVIAGAVLGLAPWRWCGLLCCIALVWVAELLNTALEHLARAVDPEENPHVRNALDIGSAAVLVAAAAAVVGGAMIFLWAPAA